MREALTGAAFVVAAVPSHGLRDVLRAAAPLLSRDSVVVSATKGLEAGTFRRMSQVIEEETGGRVPVVVLSGPSFASEVARGLPAAVLAASSDAAAAARVQEQFRGPALRLYVSDDVPGVEIGGALKNVIAIAAGAVEGLGLGHNAMAALITRGLVEISRLACAEGGRRDTLAGLSGLGDLVLTCTGDLSRNRRVGIELGRGRSLDEVLSEPSHGRRRRAHDRRCARTRREARDRAPDHRPDGGGPRGPMFPARRRRVPYGTPSARRARSVGWLGDQGSEGFGIGTRGSGFGRKRGLAAPKLGERRRVASAFRRKTGELALPTGYWLLVTGTGNWIAGIGAWVFLTRSKSRSRGHGNASTRSCSVRMSRHAAGSLLT